MCGIIGYAGNKNAANVVISGLKRLEYRGYDSAGIAQVSATAGQPLLLVKAAGKVAELEGQLGKQLDNPTDQQASGLAIGHTRWATHGEPTTENAHPHLSQDGNFAIAHNGIIENYLTLRSKLTQKGYEFISETDSEVIAHLIQDVYEGDLQAAVMTTLGQLEGTYGLIVVSSLHPDTLIAARNGSPVVIGIGQGETLIASDISALISHTKRVVYLDDGDVVTVSKDSFDITSLKNVPVSRDATEIDWNVEEIEKGGFDHFMLKEIYEQPTALTNSLRGRLDLKGATAKLSGMQLGPSDLAHIDRITIAACGTSMYAGMVGKYLFEDFASIPTDVVQAAEFRDRNPIMQRDSMMLAISQSGETADTLAAVREGVRKGATILGLCNVVGSTIARETGRGVYLHAGPEISVASTKAFTCQVAVLAMMSVLLGRTHRMSAESANRVISELTRLPELAQAVIDQEDKIAKIAEKYAHIEHAFFIGRGYLFPAVMEGALKLKEISYVHAEGYHAAELKHGPIALLTKDIPVIVAVPESSGKAKTIANMQECRARKAPVLAIATAGDTDIHAHSDDIIEIPRCEEFVAPIPVVIAEQLFAYHMARLRGCEIDQPRNLAKSVTVE
ncbi:glutamine--fructose-6-phosphate transaminase (isomerizing) [Halieaceae bacterium IMCC14734]|uniref:Glutamine--fructose-6-phosphate aminotransferase [isomerizing] n=1 Tax=Candidatus Litorirhabdus singularis TaxID=2518993 RepID=A0ABT3TIQ2_9GAMM|nr:glutamine--fructose-6-phosphate transaminase (isomerizing) [Candidatus Litorirhabdus singularis]MCX2981284.1 glutamine--fructose-6-phosphate transaminase (isomerizing) [Candidatus Litorirhabdus singularis]